MEFRKESLVRGRGSTLLRQTVGGRLKFARVVGADLSKEGPSTGLGAGRKAIEDGRYNVMASKMRTAWLYIYIYIYMFFSEWG